ncbi:DUF3179 domain-containing protein [Candidatus Poriferisodalis sp.]|uniref:DUF3179 domain-containing protein n=1 Tax=Candidatus Poriferisodalis sp. TaxID=3101277 RepID=UPI003B010A79
MAVPMLLFGGLAIGLLGCAGSSDDEASAPEATATATTEAASAATTAPASTTEAMAAPLVPLEVAQIPGDPKDFSVSALRQGADAPLLPDPLIDPAEIISGGPPPDGIPPIDSPDFERASEVGWLEPQEAVVTINLGGDARAYPTQVMIWHEIVNDTVNGEAVTVTYCPLCNSAIGYYRQLDGRTFTFGTSGRLYNSSLVMYDRQTESLWTHFTGQAVAGELTGAQLELIPVATVSFETFVAEHPDGLVLSRPVGSGRSYGSNPYAGYDDPDGSPILFLGTPDPRLGAQTRVVAIRHGGEGVAVVLDALAAEGVIATEVGGVTAVAFHLPGTATPIQDSQVAFGRDVGGTGVFNATVDGQVLTFSRKADAASSAGIGAFTDDQTGSTWTVLGRAVDGPLAGTLLEPIEHLDTFWFAASAFDPDIEIIGGP